MLEILFELLAAVLIGILEFIGEAVFEGICEVFAKFPVFLWEVGAAFWKQVCGWIATIMS